MRYFRPCTLFTMTKTVGDVRASECSRSSAARQRETGLRIHLDDVSRLESHAARTADSARVLAAQLRVLSQVADGVVIWAVIP